MVKFNKVMDMLINSHLALLLMALLVLPVSAVGLMNYDDAGESAVLSVTTTRQETAEEPIDYTEEEEYYIDPELYTTVTGLNLNTGEVVGTSGETNSVAEAVEDTTIDMEEDILQLEQ